MFKGVYTALITPFDRNGQVDYGALESQVERQIEGGVDGLVPVGTTGESPTLNVKEHLGVIEKVIAKAAGRVKVIAGTGANATAEAVELTKEAQALGADGSLQVTPYYNKPSQEGLYRHFSAAADVGLPVMLYNIPGRTGREIAVDTVARLAEHPNVAAVKEAGGSVDRITQILTRCDLAILSGDDPLTIPMMAMGGAGVVSVASNIMPERMVRMVRAALDGDWPTAVSEHRELHPFLGALLSLDTNPVPVKTAMAMMGLTEEVFRLPLCETSAENKAALQDLLKAQGLL